MHRSATAPMDRSPAILSHRNSDRTEAPDAFKHIFARQDTFAGMHTNVVLRYYWVLRTCLSKHDHMLTWFKQTQGSICVLTIILVIVFILHEPTWAATILSACPDVMSTQNKHDMMYVIDDLEKKIKKRTCKWYSAI